MFHLERSDSIILKSNYARNTRAKKGEYPTMVRFSALLPTHITKPAVFRILSLTVLLAMFSTASSAVAQMPGQDRPGLAPVAAQQSEHGFHATVGSEALDITVCGDSVIHVLARPDAEAQSGPKPWMLDASQSCAGAPFQFTQDTKSAVLKTDKIEVSLNLERGNLNFRTVKGDRLLGEGYSLPRTYEPVQLNGESTYRVTDRFSPVLAEALYGLGQHQSGLFNYRGATVELGQDNTDVAIPLLISSKGYALMWNTAALTYVDNRFPLDLTFSSIAGKSDDYYFLYGPEMDTIIHEYRGLTGHAPMLPKWSYGFFQSKDRYVSLDEIAGIAQRYRAEHIPLDAMVQDWFWWKNEGDPEFNDNFHDVPKDLDALHKENVHTMISVWGMLDPKSETYKTLDAKKLLIPGAHVYDPSNVEGRDIYWNRLPGKLLAQGWDAFWLDSAEPEEFWPHMGDAILRNKQLAIGNGAEYTNVFPLLHTLGVQDHWKAENGGKRVFLLTRSAFLGQQRVGATVWSGDVYGSYWGLSHQVAAGLNFALSGYPYWTTDIGGYWPPHDNPIADPAFQELYARWFEFGTFCPIFRTHGHRPHNELWSYDKVEPTLIRYDKLRYRLMPYIYSLAWKVSNEDYTIQRPLVMDWRTDEKTWNIGDEFMFGPAILVNPVLKADATHRGVYLPASPAWYDFWTGAATPGGQEIEADAPLDRMPLYVRAGSILPMGPEIEYAAQNPGGPIELRIYRGADGQFNLYDDAGDSYDYEKGQHSVISLRWNDSDALLTIGAREGTYPGMIETRAFRIVLVGSARGTGVEVTGKADKEITYDGRETKVSLR
jgi:alpha-D-xyloside xylohydrolase